MTLDAPCCCTARRDPMPASDPGGRSEGVEDGARGGRVAGGSKGDKSKETRRQEQEATRNRDRRR
jgi:hypothetical protein